MKFSTRTTYGLRAMVYLARNYKKQESISLSQIAKAEHISLAYLERLFALLKKEKIVEAEKGKTGGYKLKEKPENIDIFRVVKTLEGNIAPFHCIDKNGKVKCAVKSKCGASSVLVDVYVAISKTLKNMKLSDLV
ncbi:Rrf2 family transcriptional regulator [Candidatus Parcubacteria bacterium]|nr:Rrf2 family transcriptional regulator [Candidatus Parcubacteria bacterium]